MVQLSLAPARNEKLFSRNYLEDRLPNSQEWSSSEEDAKEAWKELKDVYEKEKGDLSNRKNDEEGLRHKFISPILEKVLNYSIEKEKTAFGSSSPDYALYENEEARSNALDTDDTYSNAVGLLEAKAWEKKLEMKKKDGGQLYDRLNPTVQVMEYLYNSEPRWAVLTNGKRWRLYNQEASSKMDTYYEVNLITILENDNFKQFKYFYLLFRKEAIEGGKGDSFVDKVREESNKYARDVGEDLEENLYQALLWLTKGISNVNNNDIDPEEELDKLQNESLIFLYRLVFLFYVDSREIMPDPAEQGEDLYSFPSLVDEVLDDIDNGEVSEVQTSYFNKLQEIFKMVKKGSEAQGIDREKLFVPAYNGKLFSSEEHKFLKENTIRDEFIAKVIELLARDDDDRRIDYSDLSVRHLGGIYEGLLEYELNYASEPKVLEDGKYKKLSDLDKDREDFDEDDVVDEELYLATDDEERKATGSYYTPDYIVEYIVENTVGPKVEERIEEAKQEAENKHERDQLVQEKVLDLNILDPAMGSGHFLVEVIDHIASEILEYTEKDIQGVKRDVARRCIYGVDINNMATELAKVSIWLNTISSEKPLSFLDHRIKTGNSLIGADIHEIDRHPEEDEDSERQVTIGEEFGEENAGVVRANVQQMLEKFKEIQQKEEDSPEDIKEQEKLYEEFLDFSFRKRFDVLADVYTSHYFDNNYKVDDYNRLLQAFKLSEQKEEGDEEWNEVIKEDWVQKATDSLNNLHEEDNTSSQKGFFHWKLEFPEVFFDIEEGVEQEDSGFDAVVGNPPYVKRQNLPDQKEAEYYEQGYTSTTYNYDLYLAFTERGFNLIDSKGEFGYILPSKFTTTETGNGLREFIDKKAKIREYVDFETYQVFEGVTTYTCLLFLNNTASKVLYKRVDKDRPEKIYEYSERSTEIEQSLSGIGWDLKPSVIDYRSIEEKLKDKGDIFTGIETGADKIFILEQDDDFYDTAKKYEGEIVHKTLKGGDVDPYFSKSSKLVIVPYDEHENLIEWSNLEENYPEIANYLKENEDKLRSREDGKMDNDRWYGYVYPKNLNKFDEKRIIWPDIAIEPEFSLDKDYWHVRTVASFSPLDSCSDNIEGLVPILNSKVFLRYMIKNTNKVRGGYLRFRPQYIREFPVVETNEKLEKLSRERHSNQSEIEKINLNIRDYLKTSLDDPDGKSLGEMYMPVEGLSDSILTDTKEDRDNIKIGSVEFEEQNNSLILNVSVKYKPEDDEGFDDEELDRWGYAETDLMPAMNFTVGDKMKALIKEFVPVAVDEAGGFANFREKATKTNSVVDRLEDLTLPKLDDVQQGLEKFIENKEEAEELEREIQETDEQIDAIVFDLYDLTDEEVETVLESLDTEEDEKRRILEKYRVQRD